MTPARTQDLLLWATLAFAASCGGSSSTESTGNNNPPPTAQPNDVQIVVGASTKGSGAFNPDNKTISLAGAATATVRWVNIDMTLAKLAEEVLWSRLGAESDAFFYQAKSQPGTCAFACFNATLRDYGRIGLLMVVGHLRRDHPVNERFQLCPVHRASTGRIGRGLCGEWRKGERGAGEGKKNERSHGWSTEWGRAQPNCQPRMFHCQQNQQRLIAARAASVR